MHLKFKKVVQTTFLHKKRLNFLDRTKIDIQKKLDKKIKNY